jgi:nicotinamide mononucleotide (NMN) deamidase PncC
MTASTHKRLISAIFKTWRARNKLSLAQSFTAGLESVVIINQSASAGFFTSLAEAPMKTSFLPHFLSESPF